MILIDFASVITTNRTTMTTRAISTASAMSVLLRVRASSGLDGRDGVDVGGRAADREHLDQRARLDDQRVVVRLGQPVLAADLDPSRRVRGDRCGREGLQADEGLRPDPQLRAGVQ